MRLDLFLKTSRLVKRRSLAKVLCEDGKIRVGGLPAKAARQVRVGDRIELDLGRRHVVVEVLGVPEGPVSRGGTSALYQVVVEKRSL